MKICKIYIKGFQQFQDVEMDFTNPDTGEPVDKVCFIGSNGTGKSTLIDFIDDYFSNRGYLNTKYSSGSFYLKLFNKGDYYNLIYLGCSGYYWAHDSSMESDFINLDIDSFSKKYNLINHGSRVSPSMTYVEAQNKDSVKKFQNEMSFRDLPTSLLVYSPAESIINSYIDLQDVPETNVDEALQLKKGFPSHAKISVSNVNDFWKILLYNIRKREEERDEFENKPENLTRTKQELVNDFDSINPKILDDLAEVWNIILHKAGLYFDSKEANRPYQLTDNLKAYIKFKSTNQIVPYRELSTGIRNFIFRIGHIFSLFYNRVIDKGILLVDEPENSLYPDFLFELVEIYQEIIKDKRGQNNTQMFFATHNPIIAAQFKPYERIILDWNEDGSVSARKGISPEGDDPNDILSNDFELKNLMGPEGRKMWEQYISLKKKLIKALDDKEKSRLIHEIEKIGSLYNFS